MIQLFAFYLFATLVIASAAMVIFARNPVHSVMWLILAFFNAAGLMLLAGAEFIAMLLVIVYVGAVAVLFLFVVMMLNIDFATLRSGFSRNLPFGLMIALVLLAEIAIAANARQADHSFIPSPTPGCRFLTASSGRRLTCREIFWPRTSPRLRWVSTIAPIIATRRTMPAASNRKIYFV